MHINTNVKLITTILVPQKLVINKQVTQLTLIEEFEIDNAKTGNNNEACNVYQYGIRPHNNMDDVTNST